MKEKLQLFMAGRYGLDDLGRFLNRLVLAVLAAGLLFPQLSLFAMILMTICFLRALSRNAYKRAQENETYLHLRLKAVGWVRVHLRHIDKRKNYRYFRCPACRQLLRVPKGKGKISVTCRKCRMVFKKRS